MKLLSRLFVLGVLSLFVPAQSMAGIGPACPGMWCNETAGEGNPIFCEEFVGDGEIIYCTGGKCKGTPKDDCIIGTDGSDIIQAGKGDDYVCARGGDDLVQAGFGTDRVCGGSGHDTLEGGWGRDHIYGDSEDDFLYGGHCDDEISGGDGDDECHGGLGLDGIQYCEPESDGNQGRDDSETGGNCD